jgi:hypothetical protein
MKRTTDNLREGWGENKKVRRREFGSNYPNLVSKKYFQESGTEKA